MKLFSIIFLCLLSLTACTAKSAEQLEVKHALDNSMQLLKIDEAVYMQIDADQVDKLHHAIFVSTVIKLGAIKEYASIIGTSLDDTNYFDLWQVNSLCLAANYVINYAYADKTVDNVKSVVWIEQQQIKWVQQLKMNHFHKTLEQTNCLDKLSIKK